ncbi:ABC transporter permease [Roseateles sp. DC23W]|uniref:ABC transporter permease n=1 Tax=Pelomonas dachongensis TaxID=3299029 RepID=A0ABW7EUY6_9BURK
MTAVTDGLGPIKPCPQTHLSPWALTRRRFARRRIAVASLYVIAFLYLVSLMAEFVAPYPAGERHLDYAYAPPQALHWNLQDGLHVRLLRPHVDPITFRRDFEELDDVVPVHLLARSTPARLLGFIPTTRRLVGIDASRAGVPAAGGAEPTLFLLGSDRYGRDILSRIIFGSRISLTVGLVGVLLSLVLGLGVGAISGYAGGRIDDGIQRCVEIFQSLPQLPLWIAVAAAVPPNWSAVTSYFAITVLLGLLNWTGLARVVRGQVLALRNEDYVVAARLAGASHAYVLARHLLPACSSHVIATLTLSMPAMILGETALSFLGLGLRAPVVSWGVMLQDCLDVKTAMHYPWLFMPGALVVVTVLCFNFVGDGLRDVADPYAD